MIAELKALDQLLIAADALRNRLFTAELELFPRLENRFSEKNVCFTYEELLHPSVGFSGVVEDMECEHKLGGMSAVAFHAYMAAHFAQQNAGCVAVVREKNLVLATNVEQFDFVWWPYRAKAYTDWCLYADAAKVSIYFAKTKLRLSAQQENEELRRQLIGWVGRNENHQRVAAIVSAADIVIS